MKRKMINKFKVILTVTSLFVTMYASAQKIFLEAENANRNNNGILSANLTPAIITSIPASGGKVFGNFGNVNCWTGFDGINTTTITGLTGGTCNFIIRYSNGTGRNQSMTYHLYTDTGNTVAYSLTQIIFPPTADWDTFAEITVSAFIRLGTNTRFKLQKVSPATYPFDFEGVGPRFDTFTLSFVNWTGAVSTDYDTPGNWLNGEVPPATAIINIPAGLSNYPVLSSDKTIGGATIPSGASLTIAAGGILRVTGSSVSNANIVNPEFTNGLITNTGTINNRGTIINNGNLILQSDALGTANLLSNSTLDNVTQQRYLTSNQRGWRLLSNPLANTTFSSLAGASNLTLGTNYTGAYDSATNAWSNTDGTVAMNNNTAYKVFITGQSGEAPTYATGPTNVTLKNKGTAANATPSAVATAAGYYLVANPYTAPVSVSSILAASTGLSTTVSYYNPTKAATDVKIKAGGYDIKTVTSTIAGTGNDVLIPPMGAMFFQATSAGSINVPKTAIFTGFQIVDAYNASVKAGVYTHKTAQVKAAAALTIDVASNGLDYDKLQLRFKEVGTAGSNVDFGKLPNTFLDFYSIDNSKNMAVSELELKDQTIPLGITSTIQKTFTFKVAENTIPAGYEAVLVDNVLNSKTVLAPGTTYNFAIDSAPASQGNTRFAINLKTAGSLGVSANELDSKIQLWPNPARTEVNITNVQNANDGASTIEISSLNGQVIHLQKSNPGTTTTIQTKGWSAGVYILKATNNGNETTKKLIIQ